MKKERKTPIKRTLEERMDIQKQKLLEMENVTLFRMLNSILHNKELSISERILKVKKIFVSEIDNLETKEETTETPK